MNEYFFLSALWWTRMAAPKAPRPICSMSSYWSIRDSIFASPHPKNLRDSDTWAFFFPLNKRVESTCLLLFNVIVAKSYLTYTLPLPPMIHTSDPDILFRFSRLYQDNCKSFQIHMRKGFDKEEEWKLSLSLSLMCLSSLAQYESRRGRADPSWFLDLRD